MTMTDYGLTIRGEPDDIVVEGLLGDRPELRRGDETTLTLELRRRPVHPGQITDTGGRYSAATGGFQWGGPAGAQWSGPASDSRVAPLRQRLARLAAYLEVADAAKYGRDRSGVPWYHDHVGGDDPVDSLVVELVFGDAIASLPDMWALVTGGEIQSRRIGDSVVVELDVAVLATAAEQADRSAVETNLAEPL